ncbi:MAG: hypothetical protein KIT35_18505 [Piscinibacter sp.]|uniref:hypothetical protein n=1 Tax=Piscinibacter TaxID=1114981 RepID=UPI000FDF39ED|nr:MULTISPECIES: hypothetical protein [Piscinibacter]MCW5665826.1 hypothetical protein [Piscinibacter sp.]
MPADAPAPAPDVDAIASAIRGYLAEHPNAADTVEGIRRWWLLGTLGEVPPELVEQALEQLLAQGRVRRSQEGWLPVTWSARPARRPDLPH